MWLRTFVFSSLRVTAGIYFVHYILGKAAQKTHPCHLNELAPCLRIEWNLYVSTIWDTVLEDKSRISSLQEKTISEKHRERNKTKATRDDTRMCCPVEGFRKFYYRSRIAQKKEDSAVCNPELSVAHSSGQSTNEYHDWNLKERANMSTVTPLLLPNNRLSLVLARLTPIMLMWRIGWAANSIPIYIQQHVTLHSLFIYGNCSTCFGW
jgi:hypothetical protein